MAPVESSNLVDGAYKSQHLSKSRATEQGQRLARVAEREAEAEIEAVRERLYPCWRREGAPSVSSSFAAAPLADFSYAIVPSVDEKSSLHLLAW
jgi:hypothetical protein